MTQTEQQLREEIDALKKERDEFRSLACEATKMTRSLLSCVEQLKRELNLVQRAAAAGEVQ